MNVANCIRPKRSIKEPHTRAPIAIEMVTMEAMFDELSWSILILLSGNDNWGIRIDENAMFMPAWITVKLIAQLATIWGTASFSRIFGFSRISVVVVDNNFVSLLIVSICFLHTPKLWLKVKRQTQRKVNSFVKATSVCLTERDNNDYSWLCCNAGW